MAMAPSGPSGMIPMSCTCRFTDMREGNSTLVVILARWTWLVQEQEQESEFTGHIFLCRNETDMVDQSISHGREKDTEMPIICTRFKRSSCRLRTSLLQISSSVSIRLGAHDTSLTRSFCRF